MTSSYVAATSVDEAVAAMADGARPVAGGTDLVVGARQGKAPLPQSLVAIHRLDELRSIEAMDGALRLGALASHEDIAESQVVCERLTALADASAIVGSHATRAQGTLGGNLMNASPAMETGGPLLCFDATVTLHGPNGVRWVAPSSSRSRISECSRTGRGRSRTARASQRRSRHGSTTSSRAWTT